MEQNLNFIKERQAMVAHLKHIGITSNIVLDAMLKVPRHLFVDKRLIDLSYNDTALPIAYSQTISQPYIVAFMTQAAHLNKKSKVLEIGTGSGYQAAILAEICREVFTIEVIEQLARSASVLLDKLGYDNIQTKIGTGYAGWPEAAPFDAIIITAAPKTVPKALLNQLKTGGRMIMPLEVGEGEQHLIRIIKTNEGQYTQEDMLDVRFVPMVEQ